MIIGVTGTSASGKSTVVDFLVEQEFKHYSIEYFLTEEIKKRGLILNEDTLQAVENQLVELNSKSYIVDELYQKTKVAGGDCVIDALKNPEEVASLKQHEDFYLIAVDADLRKRYKRASRKSLEPINFEKFRGEESETFDARNLELEDLNKCMEMADFIIQNDDAIEDLKEKVNEILSKMKKEDLEEMLSLEEYFMGVAILSGKINGKNSTRRGVCLVDPKNRIVGVGRDKISELHLEKGELYHGEIAAILNATIHPLDNCKIYLELFPCNECAKAIIQAGIKEVVYLEENSDIEDTKNSKQLFNLAEVRYSQLIPTKDKIVIEF